MINYLKIKNWYLWAVAFEIQRQFFSSSNNWILEFRILKSPKASKKEDTLLFGKMSDT